MVDPDQASDDALGVRLGAFSPTRTHLFVGYLIFALMIVGGFVIVLIPLYCADLADWSLPVYAEKGWSWFAVALSFLPAILLWVASPLVCQYLRDVQSRRMEIYEKGFRYNDADTGVSVLWTEVALIRETTSWYRHPFLSRMLGSFTPSASATLFTITLKSGQSYGFFADAVGSIDEFGRVLREQRIRLGLRWEFVDDETDI